MHDAPAGRPTRLDHVRRRLVTIDAVRHAAEHAELVCDLRELGDELAEAEPRDLGLDRLVERAGVVGAGLGLGVEGVGVCRAAPHPDLDDRARGARSWPVSVRAAAVRVAARRPARGHGSSGRRRSLPPGGAARDGTVLVRGRTSLPLSMPELEFCGVDERPCEIEEALTTAQVLLAGEVRERGLLLARWVAREDPQVELVDPSLQAAA